jgi:hypothetical protein
VGGKMEKSKKITTTFRTFGGLSVLGALISFLLGYFQYEGINGGLACLLFFLILGLLLFIALIPFIGWIIYYVVARIVVIPLLLDVIKLPWSSALTLIWMYCLIVAIILSLFVVWLSILLIVFGITFEKVDI